MPGFLGVRAGGRMDLPPIRPARAIGGKSAFLLFDRRGRMVRARSVNALWDRSGAMLAGRTSAILLRSID